jgi:flagellar FliL protein
MSTAATVDGAAPAKAGKKKLIILLALLLVLLAAAGGGVVFWLKAKAHAAQAENDDPAAEASADDAKAAPKRDPKAVPVFVALENFTVNLADRDTERYAQIGISLELADSKAGDRIKAFMPAIRNNILMVLAHKTSAEVLASEGKVKLAGEIQRATSRALGVDVVEPGDDTDAVDDDAATSKKKKRKRKVEPALPVVAVQFSNFIVQ